METKTPAQCVRIDFGFASEGRESPPLYALALESNMPNNDWYEYTSEEMQHLGEKPGDILGLIMHDCKPENSNDQNQETRSPQPQDSKLVDKLASQVYRAFRDWRALLVLRVWQPRQHDLNKSGRPAHTLTTERQHERITDDSTDPAAGVWPGYFTHMGGSP